MNWDKIVGEIISKVILTVFGGILGWLGGCFKTKKASSRAIERKNEIYQPLIEDIEEYSKFDWSIREKVKVSFLKDVVKNSYKYVLGKKLEERCGYLNEIIDKYNNIDTIKVAHSVIVEIFEKGYAEIYGSIVDGVVQYRERDGTEWDEEKIVLPVEIVRMSDFSGEISSLLLNEGIYSDKVWIDEKKEYEPIYSQLKEIYRLSLNVTCGGEKYVNSTPVIELKMLPEEYIALYYDFFKKFNANSMIKNKYELREEIIYTSQEIVEILKERINKIVQVYEVEEI